MKDPTSDSLGTSYFCCDENVGNLRCEGEKSFLVAADVFTSLLYSKEINKSYYLSISQTPSNAGFFQPLVQFFPLANLNGNFKRDLF